MKKAVLAYQVLRKNRSMHSGLSMVVLASIVMSFFAGGLWAFRLQTADEALTALFPDCKFEAVSKELVGVKLESLRQKLGGSIFYTKGTKYEEANSHTITFNLASKAGKKQGVALISAQPGKWGPVEVMIAMDMQGKVKKVVVLLLEETRGRPVVRQTFLGQFIGKTFRDKIKIGEDVLSVSGATVSSESAAFAVKKAVLLYEALMLNE